MGVLRSGRDAQLDVGDAAHPGVAHGDAFVIDVPGFPQACIRRQPVGVAGDELGQVEVVTLLVPLDHEFDGAGEVAVRLDQGVERGQPADDVSLVVD